MFNSSGNKKLGYVLGALALIVIILVINDIVGGGNRERSKSFRSELVETDTADIVSISILKKGTFDNPVKLTKKDKEWFVSQAGKEFKAKKSSVERIIAELKRIKPERVAATSKDSWKKYEVNDSLSTRVLIKTSKKEEELLIGKFSYQQPKNPQMQQYNPYGGPQGKMTTYVRIEGEKPVYAVDGFLSMTFNRELKDFRDNMIVESNTGDWTRISFTGDSINYNLTKENDKWMLDGLMVDSTKMADYLSKANYISSNEFIDNIKPTVNPVSSVTIEGKNFTGPLKIDAYVSADTTYKYLISSSQNKDNYFGDEDGKLYERIFKHKEELQLQ